MPPLLLFLAVLPGLLISYAVIRLDKYEKEPVSALLLCFLLGAAAIFPAVWIEKNAHLYLLRDGRMSDLETAWFAFVAISFNEELIKFGVLLAAAYPYRYFNEPFDGIVYAVLIAMGFGTVENVIYADRFGYQTVILRGLTAVPAHLVFAIIQGYYAGIAKFRNEGQFRFLLRGLLMATLFHGVYDLLIIQQWAEWLLVLATFSLYLSLHYFSRLAREHQENSPFR